MITKITLKTFVFEVFSHSTRVINECRNIKQMTLASTQRKKKKRCYKEKKNVAKLCDQKSGLYSKCWRVFTEFSKLPFVREVGVHRKTRFPHRVHDRTRHESINREGCSGLKRAYN